MNKFSHYAIYGRMFGGVLIIVALLYLGVPNA